MPDVRGDGPSGRWTLAFYLVIGSLFVFFFQALLLPLNTFFPVAV